MAIYARNEETMRFGSIPKLPRGCVKVPPSLLLEIPAIRRTYPKTKRGDENYINGKEITLIEYIYIKKEVDTEGHVHDLCIDKKRSKAFFAVLFFGSVLLLLMAVKLFRVERFSTAERSKAFFAVLFFGSVLLLLMAVKLFRVERFSTADYQASITDKGPTQRNVALQPLQQTQQNSGDPAPQAAPAVPVSPAKPVNLQHIKFTQYQ
ncbi:hypothetical protein EGW08_004698 [Elysia chlorotica]|uniref:Uncharacterized protein n=1 Tax=Elysia chlorotica TaxID=188477 RepID=A0A3S1BG51_ELYCH|nr:hypothetical protein EGW08_004698 [Elysia chlorotica]